MDVDLERPGLLPVEVGGVPLGQPQRCGRERGGRFGIDGGGSRVVHGFRFRSLRVREMRFRAAAPIGAAWGTPPRGPRSSRRVVRSSSDLTRADPRRSALRIGRQARKASPQTAGLVHNSGHPTSRSPGACGKALILNGVGAKHQQESKYWPGL